MATDVAVRRTRVLDRYAMPALRWAIGLVFVWFGLLKVIGESPVAELVKATLPFVPGGFLLPALGWFEIALGLVLVWGRFRGPALTVAAAHLVGTFLVFLQAPGMVVVGGNPLLLTASGEFVLKNLVLICALAVLTREPETR
ncbi:DoxX family protein [Actinosynnema sp. NPDC020468]|uniref:DoxX family protein n=1 Tax=Actinosynnema sp. NPDC020468 TaxID=3154488 RepID=UPI0034106B69